MAANQPLILDLRIQAVIQELEDTILQRYPDATFEITSGVDDPTSIHLVVTTDVEDPDEVGDLVVDRVVELQTDDRIPLHVIPVRPMHRVLTELNARQPKTPSRPLPAALTKSPTSR
jgi:hypothetical protein